MRQHVWRIGSWGGLVAAVVLAACSSGSSSGGGDWRLNESRAATAVDSQHVAGIAAAASQGQFAIPVPLGVDRAQLALVANDRLAIGKNARVTEIGGKQFAAVSALGGVEVDDGAAVGNVYAIGSQPVTLGNQATVHGFVKTDANLVKAASANVDVGVQEHANNQTEEYSFKVTFPTFKGADRTARAGARIDVSAAPWGRVVVEPAGTAVLHAGAYYFDALDVQPNGILEIDNSNGPVYLWVRSSLAMNGTSVTYKDTPNVLVGYAGSAAPQITTAFNGTLVAPAADVLLPATPQSHVGSVFAHSITLADGATLVHQAFEPGQADYAAAPDYGQCMQECSDSWQTVTGDCTNVQIAQQNSCDSSAMSCGVSYGLVCAALVECPPCMAGCMSASISVCSSVFSSCYNQSTAQETQCSDNADIQVQQCMDVCQ